MTTRYYDELNNKQWDRKMFLCVGIDPDLGKIPVDIKESLPVGEILRRFCADIIKATADYAGAYKPNLGFFIKHGAEGLKALKDIITFIRENFPDKVIILDGKFNDIANSGKNYAEFAFREMGADAATQDSHLNPNRSTIEKRIF